MTDEQKKIINERALHIASGAAIDGWEIRKFKDMFVRGAEFALDNLDGWVSVENPPELTEQVFWYNDDNERVPWEGKFEIHVLALDEDGRKFMGHYDGKRWAEVAKFGISSLIKPTHWRHLPPSKTKEA